MQFKKHLLAASALTLSGALVVPTFAHESRVLPASAGGVRVTVGFLGEPAFEDTYNGLDLFLFTFDKRCTQDTTDFYGNPITAAEIVSVNAEALYLDKSAPPTGALGTKLPTGAKLLKASLISGKSPISGVFGDAGHYHSWFRPTHPGYTPGPDPHAATSTSNSSSQANGAYGFHVWGEVNAKASEYTCEGDSAPTKIPARTAKFDTYWVCGAGFRDGSAESRGAFGCVQPVQAFPGEAEDGYEANEPYGKRRGPHFSRNY